MPEAETFGDRLRRLRIERGISQEQLARESSVTQAHVSLMETGKTDPSLSLIERLADIFGLTMDDLWRGLGHRRAGGGGRA